MGADSAYFFLKDGSNRTKIQMGVDSGGDPQLLLTEAGAGTDVVITLQNLVNGAGGFAVADNDQWIWTTNVSDHLELKEVGGTGVVLTFRRLRQQTEH